MGDVEIRIKIDGSSYAFGISKLRSRWQLERLCDLLVRWYCGKVEDVNAVKAAEEIIGTTGKSLKPGPPKKKKKKRYDE